MAHTPLVSVCMPAFNHAGYVGFAIESVLGQTFSDLELIIAEDRSPDLTWDVIRSYEDPRISAIRMERRSGPSTTLNTAMRRARGKYIALCSSDDLWLPQKLEQQVAYMEAHPEVGAVFHRPLLVDSNGARLPDSAHLLGLNFGGEALDRQGWLARLFTQGNCLCAITPLMRADAVRATGEFDPLMLQLQDFDYWVRFLAGHELRMLPERLTEYRVNMAGTNLSAKSMAALSRTTYECYHVLRHYASGAPADAVAALPPPAEPMFTWQSAAPSPALRIAEHALQRANAAPRSLSHLLFALDCLLAHGRATGGLEGREFEERLFSLPLFEVTGSSIAQDFFLGAQKAEALERTLLATQRELDSLKAGMAAQSAPVRAPSGGFWSAIRRALGPGRD